MSPQHMFVVDKANALTMLSQQDYDSEDLFQILLKDHPPLLSQAGGASGRLILVSREVSVPESEDGGARWSLDHLFLDGEGVPVLVEVKRASDTRSRREVVAQMLDYAANGVAYWPIAQISEIFSTASGEKRLLEFLTDTDPESYWRQVESNLKAGRVRMVFVADRIPKELRRIVEFLNEQMRPAEVLAIEVEHFTNADGLRLLVPRLVGATERAASAKAVQGSKPPLSEEQWLADLSKEHGEAAASNARRLIEWFRSNNFQVGMTKTQDSISASLVRQNGRSAWPFFVRRSSGKVETSLQYLKEDPAFASEEARTELLQRIKALPGQTITTTRSTGWPAFPLESLSDPAVWTGFTQVASDVQARTVE